MMLSCQHCEKKLPAFLKNYLTLKIHIQQKFFILVYED